MAKRILENGKYANVVTCPCGCKFSFEPSDVEENDCVTCPECGATIQLETK